MAYVNIYRRAQEMAKEIDYSHIPPAVILDLKEEFKQFYCTSSDMQEFEHSVFEILEEIFLHISLLDAAPAGLEMLRESTLHCYARESAFRDGENAAKAVYELGWAVFNKCKALGLYLPNGFMPYETVEAMIDANSIYVTPPPRGDSHYW